MLENKLYYSKELVVVSTTPERAQQEQDFCSQYYPDANITIIPSVSRKVKSAWASAEYIFSSEAIFPIPKKPYQQYIVLGYYPVALKNDWFSSIEDSNYRNRTNYAKQIDRVYSVSLIYSQIESSSYEISFGKFLPIGKCRSDVILQKEDVSFVKEYFQQFCGDYKFSKIILYTPTHRDYEQSVFDIKRSILGFNIEKKRFENFLQENEILIICKLHPRQNADVVDSLLPKGVLNFKGCDRFGLVELMKVSSMLMTDYTSVYVDYLLLNKPVIFNFYDYDLYKKIRGFSFYPLQRICAGEIFTDEESFYKVVKATLDGLDRYADKRQEILMS